MKIPLNGFILINKPAGWTSFDVVGFIRNRIRKSGSSEYPDKTNHKIKVGHAGTLDPFATGLLIVGVGREATRRLDEFKKLPKTYEAVLRLGATSDTGDSTGRIELQTMPILPWRKIEHPRFRRNGIGKSEKLKITTVDETVKSFLGKQLQIPPMYSAKSINGEKLYKLARQGIEVERQPCEIEICGIELLEYEWPRLKIRVDCGAGTYIRTLAEDIGKKLGCGAYCEELTRTRIGEYTLEKAVDMKALKHENIKTI